MERAVKGTDATGQGVGQLWDLGQAPGQFAVPRGEPYLDILSISRDGSKHPLGAAEGSAEHLRLLWSFTYWRPSR